MAIPAHVDKACGLFGLHGTSLGQVLDIQQIIGMEIWDETSAKPQLYIDKKLCWTEVVGSDAHHPNGPKCPGSHYTWVKMGTPALDGLRLALLDGALSIRRSSGFISDPNAHGHLVIESLMIDKAKYIGRGEVFQCSLNPWLNAIIGGRGTGKSSLLEFLRLTMQREKEVPPSLMEDLRKYQVISESRDDDGLLTSDASLTAIYRKDDARFQIKWNNASRILSEITSEGDLRETHGQIQQRFPVRIYSQKQIFELAKRPQALLSIVDDAEEIAYREWKERWHELQSRFLALCAKAREIQAGLSEETRIKGELEDVCRKLAIFEKIGHADILKEYQKRQRHLRSSEQWECNWSNAGSMIRDLADQIKYEEPDRSAFDTSLEVDSKYLRDVENVTRQLNGIADKLRAVATEADQLVVTWQQTKKESDWLRAINEATSRYDQLRDQLIQQGAGDPSEYGRLVQQRQSLDDRQKDLEARRASLQEIQKQAKGCLDEIKKHRQELSRRRSAFLASVLADNPYVSIAVLPYGNKDSVEDEVRELINRRVGFERDIGTVDSGDGLLSGIYRLQGQRIQHEAPSEAIENGLEDFKSTVRSIRAGDEGPVRDRRFAGHIRSLPPENLDRLECWFPEDSLDVFCSMRPGSDFMPVQQGSPGQKTAALLAFLLSYGVEPLVLDQPEDDLDNYLIYDLIVTQLREIKCKRQIIVVTHNANIVVNGDAEMVVALDIRGGRTQTVCAASLQDAIVREEICRVMEGGKEAFQLRYQRINGLGSRVRNS